MSQDAPAHSLPSLPRTQAALSGTLALVLLVGSAIPHVSVALLTRSTRFTRWLRAQQMDQWERTGAASRDDVGYIDVENRVLLEAIPSGDYSRGGAYLLGSSNVQNAIARELLPPGQRRLIGIYGISSATHTQQLQFIRYLVEEEGLLDAGGEKTMILLGLSFVNAVRIENRPNSQYFPDLFRRYGLCTYSLEGGLHRAPMSRLERVLRLEHARYTNLIEFLRSNRSILGRRPDGSAQRIHDPKSYQGYWCAYMGPQWQEEMEYEMGQLGALIDYLQARGVRVVAFEFPLASWFRQLPYIPAFHRQALAVCAARSVPFTDLGLLLDDADFRDSTHLNRSGQRKLHPILMQTILPHLRAAGALDAPM